MTRKRRRLYFVLFAMTGLGAATALVLSAIDDSLVFFYTPTDLAEKDIDKDRRMRIGGLVAENSVKRAADGLGVKFIVTDLANTLPVTYKGILPDLFREGQGVVAEGKIDAGGVFRADAVLAKHDENYMPAEVADALKKSGQWKGAPGKGAPTP